MILLVTAILFWLSGAALLKWFHFMILPNGAIDVVFGYQKFLNKLYNGSTYQQLIGKALGDCEMCMSFWFSFIWFFVFYGFCKILLGTWVTNYQSNAGVIIFLNLCAFVLFQPICGFVCFYALTKLFKK